VLKTLKSVSKHRQAAQKTERNSESESEILRHIFHNTSKTCDHLTPTPNSSNCAVCPCLSAIQISKHYSRRKAQIHIGRTVTSDQPFTGTCVSFLPHVTVLYPRGGRLQYLHRSPASRRRRRKWNPVPRDITGPHSSWRI
jgi:hypothetical protein